jgi:hypothetical protein
MYSRSTGHDGTFRKSLVSISVWIVRTDHGIVMELITVNVHETLTVHKILQSAQDTWIKNFHFPLGKCHFISHTYLWYIFAYYPNLGYRKRIFA